MLFMTHRIGLEEFEATNEVERNIWESEHEICTEKFDIFSSSDSIGSFWLQFSCKKFQLLQTETFWGRMYT